MRVSTQYQFDLYTTHIHSAHERYVSAQKQVLTGKKFEIASENTGDAHFVVSASSIRSRTAQLDKNLRSAKDYLGNTEQVFSELNSLVNNAYTIAVNGANSTYDQAARDSMAKQIAEVQRRVAYLANTQGGNGQFVFGGQKSDAKPFAETPPTLTFSGDDNPINVEVRPNETMRVNLQGAGTMLTGLYATLETLKNDLSSGNLSQIGNADIAAVQGQLRAIGSVRGDVGSKLQTVTTLAAQNARRIDELSTQISDVQDIDLTEAVTKMQAAETAYTAALQVTARGNALSLMDFLT